MVWLLPTAVVAKLPISRFKTVEDTKNDSPDFSLQIRKAAFRAKDKALYRIVTKNKNQGCRYLVCRSDSLSQLRANEWHYISHELPQVIPSQADEKDRLLWLIAHFTKLAVEQNNDLLNKKNAQLENNSIPQNQIDNNASPSLFQNRLNQNSHYNNNSINPEDDPYLNNRRSSFNYDRPISNTSDSQSAYHDEDESINNIHNSNSHSVPPGYVRSVSLNYPPSNSQTLKQRNSFNKNSFSFNPNNGNMNGNNNSNMNNVGQSRNFSGKRSNEDFVAPPSYESQFNNQNDPNLSTKNRLKKMIFSVSRPLFFGFISFALFNLFLLQSLLHPPSTQLLLLSSMLLINLFAVFSMYYVVKHFSSIASLNNNQSSAVSVPQYSNIQGANSSQPVSSRTQRKTHHSPLNTLDSNDSDFLSSSSAPISPANSNHMPSPAYRSSSPLNPFALETGPSRRNSTEFGIPSRHEQRQFIDSEDEEDLDHISNLRETAPHPTHAHSFTHALGHEPDSEDGHEHWESEEEHDHAAHLNALAAGSLNPSLALDKHEAGDLGSIFDRSTPPRVLLGGMMGGGKAQSGGTSPRPSNVNVNLLKIGLTVRPSDSSSINIMPSRSWCNIDASTFLTRIGPNYAKNKKKGPSLQSLYICQAVDLYATDTKVSNFGRIIQLPSTSDPSHSCADPNCSGKPYLPPNFIINMQLPTYPVENPLWGKKIEDGPGCSLVFYYVLAPHVKAEIQNACQHHSSHSNPQGFNPSIQRRSSHTRHHSEAVPSSNNLNNPHHGHPNIMSVDDGHLSIPSSPPSTFPAESSQFLTNELASMNLNTNNNSNNLSPPLANNTSSINNNNPGLSISHSPVSGSVTASQSNLTTAINNASSHTSSPSQSSSAPAGPSCPCIPNPHRLSPSVRLLHNFINAPGGTELRWRFKSICRLVNTEDVGLGGVSKKLVNTYNGTPFIIKTCGVFFKDESERNNYFEADADVHRFSYPARVGLGGVRENIKNCIFDVAFVIEAQTDEELPEQLLGAVRLSKLDLNEMTPLPKEIQDYALTTTPGEGNPQS